MASSVSISIAHVSADTASEHTVLLSQVVNRILLLAVDPSGCI